MATQKFVVDSLNAWRATNLDLIFIGVITTTLTFVSLCVFDAAVSREL